MVRALLATVLVAAMSSGAAAQKQASGGIPAEVANAVTFLYNASDTRHARNATEIHADSTISGNLAVRGGPVVIAGRITGSLLVINGDVTFRRGARVDGQVYVIGGTVEGRDSATIGSDFISYAETLRYHLTDDDLVIEDDDTGDKEGARRRSRDQRFWTRNSREDNAQFDVFAVAANGVYNRVEGYPFTIGPRLRMRGSWGAMTLQARGIVRTAEPMEWDRGTLGHDLKAEVRFGSGAGVGLSLGAFDRIDPVEDWHMSDRETALAAVVIQRDYRDYFSRHGGEASARAYINSNISLSVAYGAEHWESRAERDPWSLFRDREAWRPNPGVDNGHVHLVTTGLLIDTRNQRYDPGNGWFIQANVEHGNFKPDPFNAIDPSTLATNTPLDYTRGFVDARRYNRLAPGAQLNVRFVLGGWMSGDALPLQRRFSVGGPGTLPGFDYQKNPGGIDRLQCNESTGASVNLPARCDRVALAQIEYRGSLSWNWSGSHGRWGDFDSPTWLIFADAGRGWRARDDGRTTYPIESFPEFSTFKTDVGMGLDFGSMSLSVAKSLSDREEPMNVILRLSRRF